MFNVRLIALLLAFCSPLCTAAEPPASVASVAAPPAAAQPGAPAQPAQPSAAQKAAAPAPAMVPIRFIFGGVEEIPDHASSEESAWLAIYDTMALASMLGAANNPDFLGFIHEHKLERHFKNPMGGPAFDDGHLGAWKVAGLVIAIQAACGLIWFGIVRRRKLRTEAGI